VTRVFCLLAPLLLAACVVSQKNLDMRLGWEEQNRLQRDMLEVQRKQLLLNEIQQGRRR
jgi:hypothetical protein